MTDAVQFENSRILASPNKYKLATFGFNSQGGTTITKAPGTVSGEDWAQQVRIAQASDAVGIEALLPGARWIGYGGATNFQGKTFEPFVWAAAIAAVTRQTQVFATFHVPTAHPVRVAKTIATIDHISGGRFGLNIVAGWNSAEIEMFNGNQREHDERYAYADAFFAAVNTMLGQGGSPDIENDYFTIKNAYSEPKSIQRPRPVYMAAGLSPRGRQFAAENADISFIPVRNLDEASGIIHDTKARAADAGRNISVFGQTQIVCADTEKEARDYVAWYADELGDFEAAGNLMNTLMAQTRQAADGSANQAPAANPFRQMMMNKMVAGHGGEMLVGTPEMVVEGLLKLSAAGFDGSTVAWLDYEAGLAQFGEQILPLLIDAGLRVDESTAA